MLGEPEGGGDLLLGGRDKPACLLRRSGLDFLFFHRGRMFRFLADRCNLDVQTAETSFNGSEAALGLRAGGTRFFNPLLDACSAGSEYLWNTRPPKPRNQHGDDYEIEDVRQPIRSMHADPDAVGQPLHRSRLFELSF